MQPCYCIIDGQSNEQIPASIREATAADFERTAREHWQTDWRTDFIQDAALDKYALELDATRELVGLAAYRDMPEGVLVYVEYMESAPSGNPTLSEPRKYANRRGTAGVRDSAFHRLRLRRCNLFESENVAASGTLYAKLRRDPIQPL